MRLPAGNKRGRISATVQAVDAAANPEFLVRLGRLTDQELWARSVFSKPEMSLDEAPGGEGRLGHYRVSVESGWDRHRGGRRGDQREPQIPLVGVIISILSGGLVLAMGRLGRACWRRPAGWAPGRAPTRFVVGPQPVLRPPRAAPGRAFRAAH